MASPLGRLGTLPPELRIQIYNLVFGTPAYDIQIAPRSCEETKHMTVGPAINRVSRAIASETMPIFLSTNKFSIRIEPSPEGLLRGWLLHAVGTDHWHSLRDIFIWYPAVYNAHVDPVNNPKDLDTLIWSRAIEKFFWPHREMMQIYHSDRAQVLKYDVFLRPLNPLLAELVYHSCRCDKVMEQVLDWLWVDAMRLGRQLIHERASDLEVTSRWYAWTRERFYALRVKKGSKWDGTQLWKLMEGGST